MNFPTFPIFRKLFPEDRDAYLDIYKRVEPYSDFSFNNLIVWLDLKNDLEVSQHKQCVILRFTNPFEPGKAFSLIGQSDCLEAANEIFDYQASHGIETKLLMVPECTVSNMITEGDLPKNLAIQVNANHRDYVFDIKTVLELKGKTYAELRHSLNVFNREYADKTSVQTLDLEDPVIQKRLLDSLREWQTHSKFTKNDPRLEEPEALRRYIEYIEWCPAKCLGFFVSDKLIGFSISHMPPQKGWAIGNHIKCDPSIRYAFDFICYTTLYLLYQEGVRHINGEQDLGIPGLRTHKQQLGPSGYLYRYDIMRI